MVCFITMVVWFIFSNFLGISFICHIQQMYLSNNSTGRLESCEVSLQAAGSQVSLSTQKGQLLPRGCNWGQCGPVGVWKWMNLWPACKGPALYEGFTFQGWLDSSRERAPGCTWVCTLGSVWVWANTNSSSSLRLSLFLSREKDWLFSCGIRLLLINMKHHIGKPHSVCYSSDSSVMLMQPFVCYLIQENNQELKAEQFGLNSQLSWVCGVKLLAF